jgi:hypothetical protein
MGASAETGAIPCPSTVNGLVSARHSLPGAWTTDRSSLPVSGAFVRSRLTTPMRSEAMTVTNGYVGGVGRRGFNAFPKVHPACPPRRMRGPGFALTRPMTASLRVLAPLAALAIGCTREGGGFFSEGYPSSPDVLARWGPACAEWGSEPPGYDAADPCLIEPDVADCAVGAHPRIPCNRFVAIDCQFSRADGFRCRQGDGSSAVMPQGACGPAARPTDPACSVLWAIMPEVPRALDACHVTGRDLGALAEVLVLPTGAVESVKAATRSRPGIECVTDRLRAIRVAPYQGDRLGLVLHLGG